MAVITSDCVFSQSIGDVARANAAAAIANAKPLGTPVEPISARVARGGGNPDGEAFRRSSMLSHLVSVTSKQTPLVAVSNRRQQSMLVGAQRLLAPQSTLLLLLLCELQGLVHRSFAPIGCHANLPCKLVMQWSAPLPSIARLHRSCRCASYKIVATCGIERDIVRHLSLPRVSTVFVAKTVPFLAALTPRAACFCRTRPVHG